MKKLQLPWLGKRTCCRGTVKEGPAGKATAAVVSSGRMRPAARMREALTEGRSSITVRMRRSHNVGKKSSLLHGFM